MYFLSKAFQKKILDSDIGNATFGTRQTLGGGGGIGGRNRGRNSFSIEKLEDYDDDDFLDDTIDPDEEDIEDDE